MTLADPEQLNKMIRDTLKGIGVDDKSIEEVLLGSLLLCSLLFGWRRGGNVTGWHRKSCTRSLAITRASAHASNTVRLLWIFLARVQESICGRLKRFPGVSKALRTS